jgi:hypothetical protein
VPFRFFCIADALLLPGLFALLYYSSYPGARGIAYGHPIIHPGIFVGGLMAFLTGRAALKFEMAVRAPLAYSVVHRDSLHGPERTIFLAVKMPTHMEAL